MFGWTPISSSVAVPRLSSCSGIEWIPGTGIDRKECEELQPRVPARGGAGTLKPLKGFIGAAPSFIRGINWVRRYLMKRPQLHNWSNQILHNFIYLMEILKFSRLHGNFPIYVVPFIWKEKIKIMFFHELNIKQNTEVIQQQ